MDVHIYRKKTGKYIETLHNVQPGQVYDFAGEPHEIILKYEETELPPTRWPEGAEL